jgi:hypothetical protein
LLVACEEIRDAPVIRGVQTAAAKRVCSRDVEVARDGCDQEALDRAAENDCKKSGERAYAHTRA